MYDHNIKAGNQGDAVKHSALITAASELMKTCGDTFHYADTYAGYAYNPLKSDGEWRDGIGVLHDSSFTSQNPSLKFWQELWECKSGLRGSVYPGSSLFMLKLCMENGLKFQARLWDISPAVISQLVTFYDHKEVNVFPRPSVTGDFSNYKPDLLLIDPPDLNDVDYALELFKLVENVILWLPITTKNGVETDASCYAFQKCKDAGMPVISVNWNTNKNTRGCRLVYRLPENAGVALIDAVNELTEKMSWQTDDIKSREIIVELTQQQKIWASKKKQGATPDMLREKLKEQKGKCALSGVDMIFDKTKGTPKAGGEGCHPLYAAVDHKDPGNSDGGYQIVCYALNDLKGHLPTDCFQALSDTQAWNSLMKRWRSQAEQKNIDDHEAFKKLLRPNAKQK